MEKDGLVWGLLTRLFFLSQSGLVHMLAAVVKSDERVIDGRRKGQAEELQVKGTFIAD